MAQEHSFCYIASVDGRSIDARESGIAMTNIVGSALDGGRSVLRGVLDVLLPPQCLYCGVLVDAPGALCATCWASLRFIEQPHCAACGLPFEYDVGDGSLCAGCFAQPPLFERARAAIVYDDHSRGLILAFKHGDRTDTAGAFGRWMARAGRDLIADADLLTPVPLHWLRLLKRRYNQSALLAQAIGALAGRPVVPDLLVRVRRTPSLGKLGRSARRKTVQGAISVRRGRKERVAGRRVLLIDDVMTTGATVDACTRALRQAGAGAVDVLTLARVVRTSVS
jgi:ComF family protein